MKRQRWVRVRRLRGVTRHICSDRGASVECFIHGVTVAGVLQYVTHES